MSYRFEKNTFVRVENEDKKDFLEAEVGDIKQSGFHPQVKIKRWDNHVNLSVRFKHHGKGLEKFQKVDDKITWKKGSTEAHFYGIDGGYEFEVIYHKKPDTNVTEFTIQTKGLDFFYQGELTENQRSIGCHRPENVVGSYAVYMEQPKKNYVGGKLWRAGKVAHIYRPKVTDASGKEVWGILNVDKEKGILSVTVPQEFLDTAIYPVVVDPTIGYDVAGGSNIDVGSDHNAFCNIFGSIIATSGDVVQQYHFYAKKEAANETVALNLYRIESDTPTTKLTGTDQSVNVNSTTAQWWNSSVISVGLTQGYEYGVAYGGWGGASPNENTQIYFDDMPAGKMSSYNSATSLSATWNESNDFLSILSLYATFQRGDVTFAYTYKIFIDKGKL